MKLIIIDVLDNGEIKLETRGYTGKTCLEETVFIKNILGSEITSQLTPAYYIQGKETIKKFLPLCG